MFSFDVAKKGQVLVNSHRGDCIRCPENTMPAFISAVERDTSCIEIDIAMTADEELVVIHDPSVNRTSDGSGYVEQMTLAELEALDFGGWFHSSFEKTSIPKFSEVLEWAIEHGVGLIVEAKQRRNHHRFAEKLTVLIEQTPNAVDHIQLLGFDHTLVNLVKECVPSIQLQVVTLARYQNQLNAVLESNASAVCVEYPYTTRSVLEGYKSSGLTTRLYLPNKDKNMKPTQWFNQYYGYDVHSEIIQWLSEGLIDMISHDDIDMLKELVHEAGMEAI
ncbi:glycerophosphodiester phosphodiesterase [Vibrio splendidus]|uniref:Glycerophosphodiester phosphodiesterase n=2 Tax=Vibrio TaxID=662 RepID=A0A837NWG7_VIBSP|nr:glycerophosphodiester phosphodiesterase family protein [Vibrio splendidus]KPL94823.1 glycerophosphodiester phosphodiesterase [Vibrio splendidus]